MPEMPLPLPQRWPVLSHRLGPGLWTCTIRAQSSGVRAEIWTGSMGNQASQQQEGSFAMCAVPIRVGGGGRSFGSAASILVYAAYIPWLAKALYGAALALLIPYVFSISYRYYK